MSRQFQFWSYEQFVADHKKCRDNMMGRPVRKWCRTHLVGTDYDQIEVRLNPSYYGRGRGCTPLFRVHPDNTITFVASVEEVLENNQSLSASLHKLVRFSLTRWKKGVYRIGGTEVADRMTEGEDRWSRKRWYWLANEAPQYFKGIRFDMATGECLNAMPDTVREAIPEMRTEWLRCLRRYKRGLKARARVGALSEHTKSAMAARATATTPYGELYQKWDADWLTTLLECMQSETYPEHILTAFVRSVPRKWRATEITPIDIVDAVDTVLNTHSQTLREQYGVFGEVLYKKE